MQNLTLLKAGNASTGLRAQLAERFSMFNEFTCRGTSRVTEETYRGIVEHAINGIFQTTPDGRHLLADQALAKICGYASIEELKETVSQIARQLYVAVDLIRLLGKLDSLLTL